MKDDVIMVKDVVEAVLKNDERTRNDDKWLVIKVLQELGINIFIPYDKLDVMPSFESITRARRKFQEAGMYPPTVKVAEHRREEEQKMRKIDEWIQ
jgi:hypothetical protein